MAATDPDLNPDHRTLLLAISGDTDAFAVLVRQHQPYISTLLYRSCRNRALADDLTQATFLKAWQSIATLRDAAAFRAWLRRIALNMLVDAVRRRKIDARACEPDSGLDTAAATEAHLVERIDMESALVKLGFHQRTCLMLAYGEGMSHAEIAQTLGLPLGTAKSHIARGLAQLRVLLEPKEDVDEQV
ncbi:MAG: sigma-70 family RNA polymerase sigma factor [Sphingopyxis sp.]